LSVAAYLSPERSRNRELEEKWQDSDKGKAYEAWIEPYEDDTLFARSELSAPEPAEVEIDDPADEMVPFAAEPE
jgi:hypothetical protein